MARSPQTTDDEYARAARAFAIAANMLDNVDEEAWRAQGLSKFDVILGAGLGSLLLRSYSIELGLKDILTTRMQRPTHGHDLVRLWNVLTDEWKEELAEGAGVPLEDIPATLRRYKDTAVNARYGKSFGEETGQAPNPDRMLADAEILRKRANKLGFLVHGPITAQKAEPGEPAD